MGMVQTHVTRPLASAGRGPSPFVLGAEPLGGVYWMSHSVKGVVCAVTEALEPRPIGSDTLIWSGVIGTVAIDGAKGAGTAATVPKIGRASVPAAVMQMYT